jgi:hypothetical protein
MDADLGPVPPPPAKPSGRTTRMISVPDIEGEDSQGGAELLFDSQAPLGTTTGGDEAEDESEPTGFADEAP